MLKDEVVRKTVASQDDRREVCFGAMLWVRHRDQDHAPAVHVVKRCLKSGMRQAIGRRQASAGLIHAIASAASKRPDLASCANLPTKRLAITGSS